MPNTHNTIMGKDELNCHMAATFEANHYIYNLNERCFKDCDIAKIVQSPQKGDLVWNGKKWFVQK